MDAFIDSTIQLLIEWGLPGLFISALLAGSIVPFSSELVLVALVKLGQTQVVFTALFYLMLIYIPIIISLRLPMAGEWRAYADPAYISLFPVLSDLWSVGLSMIIGGYVAKWIFK